MEYRLVGVIGSHYSTRKACVPTDSQQLHEMKKVCNSHCLSTCPYVLGYYYNNANVVRWILKQGLHGWSGRPQLADA